MKVSKLLIVGVLASVLCMVVPATAAHITFTGDVSADFVAPGRILTLPDTVGDVGFPATSGSGTNAPAPGTPGWEMSDFRLTYDEVTDTLYVGLNSVGIAGDADGDGDPGNTSTYLSELLGADNAGLSGTEGFAVYFDFDQDGNLDVIAGVSGSVNYTGFSVATTLGIPGNPLFNFGVAIPSAAGSALFANPSASDPDIEFTILNFSTLPGQDGDGKFNVTAFMGSLEDDGIGEDFIAHSHNPDTMLTIISSASEVVTGGTVNLTITETNTGTHELYDVEVEVTQEGAALATLTDPPDSGDTGADGILGIGESWVWTIPSNPITADATTFEATATARDPLDQAITVPGHPAEQDAVDVDVLVPSTITSIISSAASVPSGGAVNLTVTEENDGETDLTSPQVVVTKNGAPLATLVAPPDSGDDADGVLEIGETWSWTISSGAITVDPTNFVATGSGTDPASNVITYPGDLEERDEVSVDVLQPNFTVTKECVTDPVPEGEDAEFQITITNTGDVDLSITTDEAELPGPVALVQGQVIVLNVLRPVLDGDVENTITVTATVPDFPDIDPIVKSATDTCTVQGNTFCSFTQGYWGNAGGKKCGGQTTTELLNALLFFDDVVVGVPGRSITFDNAECIILRLPAGGTPSALPVNLGDADCDVLPASLVKKNKPEINNVLVGQVVTLTLNVRLGLLPCIDNDETDGLLGLFVIPEDPFCTVGVGDENGCPKQVDVGGFATLTVDELLAIANQALGGEDISPYSISGINSAVTAINEGFDECRTIVPCPEEICDNLVDDDCDGLIDAEDDDCQLD